MNGRTERTPEKSKRFLNSLRKTGNITKAARAAGLARRTAYEWRDADEAFAAAWDEALEEATDALELEARRRAEEGVTRVKFHQGKALMVPEVDSRGRVKYDEDGEMLMRPYVEHEYSDTLLIFLLKAHRPDKFKDRQEVTGPGGGPLEVAITRRIVNAETEP